MLWPEHTEPFTARHPSGPATGVVVVGVDWNVDGFGTIRAPGGGMRSLHKITSDKAR